MKIEDIAIIIPTYRPGSYIEDCIASINSQTIDKALLRVFFILNGPKEPYFSKLRELINKYSRFNILLLYNEELGVSKARNIGIERALLSKYVIFIDDDDYVSPNYVKDLHNAIEIRNADVVQSNFKEVRGGIVSDDYISKAYKKQLNKTFSLNTHRNFFSSVCGKIFRSNVFSKKRFREDISMAEDAIFMFEISMYIKKFCLSNESCVYYRNVRLGSALFSKRGIRQILYDYKLNFLTFTKIYFGDPINYSFIFYMTRLMAITKFFWTEVKIYFSVRNL